MSQGPDIQTLLTVWWNGGCQNNAFAGSITQAQNLVFGSNPPYLISDFLNVYPKFGTANGSPPVYDLVLPPAVLQMYVNLASASINFARWQDQWLMGMALFIAHFATLYMESEGNAGTTPGAIARSGLASGILVSQSAGNVSQSVQPPDLEEFAAWNLTIYGQNLATLARIIGIGPMYVR
jgi:hypothetical protein